MGKGMNNSIKKGVVVAVILLFVSVSVIPSTGTTVVKKSTMPTFYDGNTLYVGGSGPNNYTRIQDAIDNASDGDTVFVYDDLSPYVENIMVDKSINLIGEDKNTTVIDGSDSGDVVHITADWVNISGFTIKAGEKGIVVTESSNAEIFDNRIYDCYWVGIYIIDSSKNNVIRNNVSSCQHCIYIRRYYSSADADNNIVSENVVRGASLNGILIESDYNRVYRNNVSGWVGINVDGDYNKILENNVTNNQKAITLGANFNIIASNLIINNGYGVMIWGLTVVQRADSNKVYHNNFINNGQNALNGEYALFNKWDNGIFSGGNYWDDYTGKDILPPYGKGDTPYKIPGTGNKDRYPLMKPWPNPHIKNIPSSQSIQQSNNMWLYRILERFPILNQFIIRLVERVI